MATTISQGKKGGRGGDFYALPVEGQLSLSRKLGDVVAEADSLTPD